ncbi:DNA recombination protein RmuC [Pleionea sp. CnH1-48]|uniref:DNA recombination protein RmuC n=1 Tax=Pleionea sp. CnH1-48 TaxID=2954494 RepID=UPI0020971E62|nr:DNA recombination protein RmuC [Pleionea sp. CnH1-48]MCO7223506.1 DNA recombination protein RmuC [Pleionea sp. CnH1-48]
MINNITLEQSVIGILAFSVILLFILLSLILRRLSSLTKNHHESSLIKQELSEQLLQLREVQLERFSQATADTQYAFSQLKESLTRHLGTFQLKLDKQASVTAEKLLRQQHQFQTVIAEQMQGLKQSQTESFHQGLMQQQRQIETFRVALMESLQQSQTTALREQDVLRKKLVEELRTQLSDIRDELKNTLNQNTEQVTKGLTSLTQSTDDRLQQISGQVEKRLTEGFEKTTQTFSDVLKRLALIDDAQKKITELSSNVVSLQQVLADKRSRGAFGEVQLNALIRNVLPAGHYAIQHKLSNNKIADCMLFLPEPTGHVAIDAKFPLESYQRMTDFERSDIERAAAARQFKLDIKKHIRDIKDKYIIAGETAAGAMMFIPAEAIFAEIHGHHSELVDFAHKEKVWLVSPTTMMAILTTASAVIKDEATREQVHVIQQHLGYLAQDFDRFQQRMDSLSRHINQVSKDVDMVHTSAKKITNRFSKIEQVEIKEKPAESLISN